MTDHQLVLKVPPKALSDSMRLIADRRANGGDDLLTDLVEARVEAGLFQLPALLLVQHAKRRAGFQPLGAHPAYHLQYTFEILPLRIAPGGRWTARFRNREWRNRT